jgi:hypothetical protein
VIVKEPVYQQDGPRCCVHVVMEESALFGTEAAEIVTAMPAAGTTRRGQQAERIQHDVCGGPGGLEGKSGHQVRELPSRELRKPWE